MTDSVTLVGTFAQHAIRVHGVEESLDVYRTIAFGIETMRDQIQISRTVSGQIDASAWWRIVPEVYRTDVGPVVERVSREVIQRGDRLDDEALNQFVGTMNDAIWREVKAVR